MELEYKSGDARRDLYKVISMDFSFFAFNLNTFGRIRYICNFI